MSRITCDDTVFCGEAGLKIVGIEHLRARWELVVPGVDHDLHAVAAEEVELIARVAVREADGAHLLAGCGEFGDLCAEGKRRAVRTRPV